MDKINILNEDLPGSESSSSDPFLSQYSKPPGLIRQRLQSLNEGCLYTLAPTSGPFRKHRNVSVWLSLQSQVIKRSRNKPISNPNPGAEWCWGEREGEEGRGAGGWRWKWEKDHPGLALTQSQA